MIGRDGRALEGPSGQDLSFEKFAINIGPGQTWDVLFKWYDAEDYNPAPTRSRSRCRAWPTRRSASSTAAARTSGTKETLPPGIQTLNQCGEYYIISHNHALFQITSWGANMTGPITYMRIDPPSPTTADDGEVGR